MLCYQLRFYGLQNSAPRKKYMRGDATGLAILFFRNN